MIEDLKKSRRAQIRARRKQLSSDFVMSASRAISEKMIQLPVFLNSQHIAYYLPNENEIDTRFIAQNALLAEKQLYLPVFLNNLIHFYPVDAKTQYQKNQFGIDEPCVLEESVPVTQFDLMIIPLVLFDAQGHRVGRGAGCYDRFLANVFDNKNRPVLIGLAYEFQKIESIVAEKWDVPMDYVVTENEIYTRDEPAR